MSGLYGSCCEEKEAEEAAFRAKIRAATAESEARMPRMRAHRVREEMRRALRCTDPCCAGGCGDCDEEPSPEALPPPSRPPKAKGDDDDDDEDEDDSDKDLDEFDDDDAMEAMLMAKMRQQRLQQLQGGAEEAQRRQSTRGTHKRLPDSSSGAALAQLLSDPSDVSPIVLHLAVVPEDADEDVGSERCEWVEEVMRKEAYAFPHARLLTVVCKRADTPPECLDYVRQMPCLVAIEKGVVTSIGAEALGSLREPNRVQDCARRWLEAERERFAARTVRAAAGSDDDDDDDDTSGQQSFCGRPGCRAYPHEHVGATKATPAGIYEEGGPYAR